MSSCVQVKKTRWVGVVVCKWGREEAGRRGGWVEVRGEECNVCGYYL
jgi:hypothetical protein